ncbi:50S ribosomal protein L35 [Ferroacidibacillus organovorans]|uniref:Large ribosomal subunit protein bL35 n=1 Tax=Ferroacidibacillus organovorans TaxID=1765683 RepID=A0A162U9B4_9BACL|nr:50S ribosomal protein L35 [Ferroacidibacillus organovorans]KYP81571.1 50S ribosomal protein L35 [Ferroacidibacillus organovorans]OAG94094.1 50S ribosomal protein L35 [Ferroacidibacillus organovorans]OPG16304.1 50S ribosomal protein L35 [Ferroacidibacillus organovorans]
MPKMKTHRGAAKRFKKTGSGKIKRNHAFTSHLFTSKSAKRKRQLRHSTTMSPSDVKRIKQMITYL